METQHPMRSQSSPAAVSLASLGIDQDAVVCATAHRRLSELGFTPGTHVRVIAKAWFRGPIAVRVGSDTFALRCHEAQDLMVAPITP